MNWNRGLFRIWMVFSVIWVGVAAIAAVEDWPRESMHAEKRLVSRNIFDQFDEPTLAPVSHEPLRSELRGQRIAFVREVSLMAISGPSLLLAFGAAVLWAIRGFRPRQGA